MWEQRTKYGDTLPLKNEHGVQCEFVRVLDKQNEEKTLNLKEK